MNECIIATEIITPKKISFSYTLIIILTVYNEVRSFKHKENRVAVVMEKIQKLSDPIGP